MTISAKIVCDSVAPHGGRITTFVLSYPRWLHPEIMTHRIFSRNSSSSRAMPIKRLSKSILDDISYPIIFKSNKAGMQGGEPLPIWKQAVAKLIWKTGALVGVTLAQALSKLGAAKETANRLQESYGHITVVLTSTDFANFFALRYHHMAQPEICELAKQMYELYKSNKPDDLFPGGWHLPFISKEEMSAAKPVTYEQHLPLIKKSVARCARVSYLTHTNKKPTEEEDFALYDRLVGNQPIHASPAEHPATPCNKYIQSGNFTGFTQYRKMLPNENITVFNGTLK